jgi:penicillin-binding protein 1A
MQHALKNTPVTEVAPTAGVVHEGGDWFFNEFTKATGVSTLGVDGKTNNAELPVTDEKKKIIDLFKN